MEHKLRLAERRNLLTGNDLSKVQEFAVELLMVADARENQQDFLTKFKLAIVTNDPSSADVLFGEGKANEVEPTEEFLSDPTSSFVVETNISSEEAQMIMEQLLMNPQVTLTNDDLADNDGWQ